jgi:NAD(P)-dependent dehydrogenase (short-subunit alcohol dehydrogenase family)
MPDAPEHAVVVGGTKGLGAVVVERFLARGFTVTVLSRAPSDRQTGNPCIRHVAVNLENPREIEGTWLQACEPARPVRYLALCQRFRGEGNPWAGELQVGLAASRSLIEGFAPHFCDNGDRGVGIVSSVYAQFVGSSQPVGYHVVKAGLNAMGPLLCLSDWPSRHTSQCRHASYLCETRITPLLCGERQIA